MTSTSNHGSTSSYATLLSSPQQTIRFNMGLRSKTSSLPFTVKKSSSNSYIPFSEFEAAYLAKQGENGEQEKRTATPAKQSSNLSASLRAWNLMSLFPRASTAVTAMCESRSQIEFNPSRLDRTHETEDGNIEKLLSWKETRSEDLQNPIKVSSNFSIGESSSGVPSIATSTTSSAQFSCDSCSRSDILNAVQRVRSEEETVSSLRLSSVKEKRSYSNAESPEAKTIESSEPSSFSALVETTPFRLNASKGRNDEAPVQEIVPKIRNNGQDLAPREGKRAEKEMAELILRRKRLLAGAKTKKHTSSSTTRA